MIVRDPGHVYDLDLLDETVPHPDMEVYGVRLVFVKREGPGYPGNVGHHPGTTIQEVLRALIDRVKYLDNQIPHDNNRDVIRHLRLAIWHLELRAAERHQRSLPMHIDPYGAIENVTVCPKCLHIGCEGACHP